MSPCPSGPPPPGSILCGALVTPPDQHRLHLPRPACLGTPRSLTSARPNPPPTARHGRFPPGFPLCLSRPASFTPPSPPRTRSPSASICLSRPASPLPSLLPCSPSWLASVACHGLTCSPRSPLLASLAPHPLPPRSPYSHRSLPRLDPAPPPYATRLAHIHCLPRSLPLPASIDSPCPT